MNNTSHTLAGGLSDDDARALTLGAIVRCIEIDPKGSLTYGKHYTVLGISEATGSPLIRVENAFGNLATYYPSRFALVSTATNFVDDVLRALDP